MSVVGMNDSVGDEQRHKTPTRGDERHSYKSDLGQIEGAQSATLSTNIAPFEHASARNPGEILPNRDNFLLVP